MKKITAAIRSIFGSSTQNSIPLSDAARQIAGLRLVGGIPIFGKKSFARQYSLLLWVLAPLSLVTIVSFLSASVMTQYNAKNIEIATQLQMLSQRVARLAPQVGSGDAYAVESLKSSRDIIIADVHKLESRNFFTYKTKKSVEILKYYTDQWSTDNAHINTLLMNAGDLSSLRDTLTFIQESAETGRDILVKIQALDIQNSSSLAHVSLIDALDSSLSEASKMGITVQNSVTVPDDALAVMEKASQVSTSIVNLLLYGSNTYSINAVTDAGVIDRLVSLRAMLSSFGASNSVLISQVNKSRSAKVAAAFLVQHADDRLQSAQNLVSSYDYDRHDINIVYSFSAVAGLLSLMLGFFLIWLKLQETRLRSAQIDESVGDLMADMMAISEGNMTVRTRVAENATGSIADSLNLTVAILNKTLSSVKESSNKVLSGSDKIHAEATEIKDAVSDQARKIQGASISVNSIAESVQSVAFAAEQSAGVAKDQLKAADDGRRAVENVIASMDSIRDQIQDTAKRLKLLGEKTQSIDEIIDLIAESTEKTNVLAMNASIQAAAAGEHGRGFRAVAAQVQRLAENQEVRLKEIVAMVRSNQSTASNAIASMEVTTQFVVEGTKVANDAGTALRKIETVAGDLSQLIQAITEATSQQRDEAENISDAIADILWFADDTAKGVEQATIDIAYIAGMASELDDAMKQFKLS
jgi:twitching motility protein PilJ